MAFNYKTDPCPFCENVGFISPLVGALDSGRIGSLRRRSPSRIGGDGFGRDGLGRDGIRGDDTGIDEVFPVPVKPQEDWKEAFFCSFCDNIICL